MTTSLMRHRKLIAGLVLAFVAVVFIGSYAAYRMVERAFGKTHVTTSLTQVAAPKKLVQTDTAALPQIIVRGDVMAQAFRNGRLPSPLPQPQGATEQAAAELAQRVMAQDDQSTAALLTALQMSGFSVRADDGTVALESVTPGQGIVIDAWEVAALAKLFGDGMHVRLTDFSNSLARTIPPLKDAPVATLLLDGLRAAAQGNQPAMRFWADFIAELGRHAVQPYDLLAPDVDTANVEIDSIQISLILRRLAADLMLNDRKKTNRAHLSPGGQENWPASPWEETSYNFEGSSQWHLGNAAWHPDHGPHLVLVQEAGRSDLPCTLKEIESQILDSNAYAAAIGYDKMLEYLEEHGMEGAGAYSKGTNIANAILALIKLYAFYACLETDITMSGDPPLVRTQSIYTAGEKRTLTATVRENIGKWQALNCARLALNGANLDISLPNDGPVAGVKTQWVLTNGSYDVSHGEITYPFVELVFPDGAPLVQNASVPVSDASAPKTDEEGHTTIDIEGAKQREQLVKPVPIMKQAEVRFTVAAKAVTMRQDLIDAVGNGLSIPIGVGVGGPVEMLLRSNIYFSKALQIPVKDWDTCEGGWGGTISYTRTWHWTHSGPNADWYSTEARDQTTRAEVHLRGNPNAGPGWVGQSHGTYSAVFSGKRLAIDRGPMGCTCSADETATATGGGEIDIDISPRGDNKYWVGAMSGTGTSSDMVHHSCSGCKGGKAPPDTSSTATYQFGFPAVIIQADPNDPGVLRGSTTIENDGMPGENTTVKWNLTKCESTR